MIQIYGTVAFLCFQMIKNSLCSLSVNEIGSRQAVSMARVEHTSFLTLTTGNKPKRTVLIGDDNLLVLIYFMVFLNTLFKLTLEVLMQ